MRRLLLGVVAALALVLVAPAVTATVTVQITKTAFTPANLTIGAGDSVTWHNADTVDHQVVANGGQFASPTLAAGKTYTHAFPRGGTFHYHDALYPKLKGTITVKGLPPVVTLAVSAPVVKYGSAVTLSGTVNDLKAGESVTIVALPSGQTTKQVVATLQTTTNGAFSFSVTPEANTLYQAQWKGAESSVTVQVAPVIKLPGPSRGGWFHFYVTAGTSFAGHYVYLQRLTLAHQWISIRKLVLGSRSGRLVSVRSIRAIVPRGRWSIRVLITPDQVGPAYVEGWSGTQPIVRR
ncbi:MAG TPA: cupredoxin domain-containing protein [Gaiellaceae bacterium]|nr:cupredoxin domain-containing protein [Gaiellaceae bacterium]